MEVKVLRHHHHVALLLVHERKGLADRDAAQSEQGTGCGNGVGGKQRDLTGSAKSADAEAATGCCAKSQFVEQPEMHLRIGKDHFEIASRNVLEQLHVDVVLMHFGRQSRSRTFDGALGLLAGTLLGLHDLANACFERLQLKQNE